MRNEGKFERIKTHDNFATEKVDVIKNKLLGDYNSEGKYSIKEEIINELVLMPKTQQNTFGSSVFAAANNTKFGNINFEIVFKKSQKQNVFLAEFYVLEAVDKINGYVQNTQKTPLGSYKDFISDDFINKALALFNIVNDGEGKEFLSGDKNAFYVIDDPLYIQNRKNIVSIIDKLTANKFNLAYKTYFTKRMLLLEQEHTSYSLAVLKTFHAQHDKIGKYFINENDKQKFKSLNELLDNCIDAVSGVRPEFEQDEKKFREKQDLFTTAFASEIEKSIDPAVRKVERGQEKDISKIKEIYSTSEAVFPADFVKNKEENSPVGEFAQVGKNLVEGEFAQEGKTGVRKVTSERGDQLDYETSSVDTSTTTGINRLKSGAERTRFNNRTAVEDNTIEVEVEVEKEVGAEKVSTERKFKIDSAKIAKGGDNLLNKREGSDSNANNLEESKNNEDSNVVEESKIFKAAKREENEKSKLEAPKIIKKEEYNKERLQELYGAKRI